MLKKLRSIRHSEEPAASIDKHGTRRAYCSTSFHYLRLCLNYASICGLVPFRIREGSSGFEIYGGRMRQICCAIVHLGTMTVTFMVTYQKWPTAKILGSPWLLFQNGLVLSIASYFPVFFYQVWRGKSSWIFFFRQCDDFDQSPRDIDFVGDSHANTNKALIWNWKKSAILHIILLLPYVCSICMFAASIHFVEFVEFENKSEIASNMSLLGPVYLNPDDTICMGFSAFENEILYTITMKVTHAFELLGMVLILYFEFIPVISALTIRHISLEFENVLSAKNVSDDQVLRKYFFTRDLVDKLNSIVSPIFVVILFMGMMYYSMAIVMMFDADHWATKLAGSYSAIGHFSCLIMAARASKRINKIKRWIVDRDHEENQDSRSHTTSTLPKKDPNKLLLYLHICDEPVGLKCGPLFTITYRSLATGLGMLSTYTIIVLQIYSQPSIVPPMNEFFQTATVQ